MDDFYSVRDVPTEPLQTNSKLITTSPFFNQEDYILFIVAGKMLKAFNLIEKISELELPEQALQIMPYLFNRCNALLIAYSTFVAVYIPSGQNIMEASRYNCQLPKVNTKEQEIFNQFKNCEATAQDTAQMLEVISQEQKLSSLAQRFLSLPNPPEDQPQHPQDGETNLGINRARLLDGVQQFKDKITALAVIDCSDNTLNTLTGRCIVIGTENSVFQILKSDLSEPQVTLILDEYQSPISIQMEGVIGESKSKNDEISINTNVQTINTTSNQSWRATILTQQGSILSIRNNQISANKIETDSIPRATFRIGKSIFMVTNSPFPAQLQRVSVRGRIDMQYALPSPFISQIPVNIELGKPFIGFMLILAQNKVVFCAENGPTKFLQIDSKSQLNSCFIGRFGINDTVFVHHFESGRVQYKLLKKSANLTVESQQKQQMKAPVLDVESIDRNDSRFQPLPIAEQVSIFRQFLPSRAAARNAVLGEILSKTSSGVQQKILQMDFIVQCSIEGQGPMFSVVVEIKNVSKNIIAPSICSIVSQVLVADKAAIMIPTLCVNGKSTSVFLLKMTGGPQGAEIEGHEIQVEVGDDGQRALWTGVISVPGFIY
ncbi:hypothetical protein SS50377_23681 [Spironucleus salmonicida]|uniref:Bardet-Biedl syndrome 1 N-terminal domain-containing protein n=1 Tax=Spironucleus salmonicida TaxID=348837 RepID=V6M5Q1_9EUKA|nr:hypothetical protein SS50377_23681 [Spironucleus salmonicida]|eukprot:EST48664.1 hypothetical protein SS50377_11277 [Spironucleus salmonicida]